MKHIFEYLFSKKSDLDKIKTNRFGITKKDMIGNLEKFQVGVVVRMLEEQELQGNNPDVKVFQKNQGAGRPIGGFDWNETECGRDFWFDVIRWRIFKKFYEKYPKYKKYDI